MSEHDKVNDGFSGNYDKPSTDYLNLDPNVKDETEGNLIEEPILEDDLEEGQDNQDAEEEESDRRHQKKYNVQEAFQIAQREKYNAIAENERLKQENSRLKNVSDQSTEAALRHYEENVNNRLNRATAMFEVAEERGDVSAKAYAIKEMNDANSAVNELNRWKSDNQYNNAPEEQYQQNQYQPDPYQGYQQPAQSHSTREMEAQAAANGHNWMAKNTWFNEGSRDYDPELSSIAKDMSSRMDNELIRRGQGDAIGSPRYLQELDYHLNQVRSQGNRGSNNTQVQNRGLNMKQSRSPVSSVRNSGASSYNYNNRSKSQVKLTPEQAEFARANKFNPESYMKRIMALQKKKSNQ